MKQLVAIAFLTFALYVSLAPPVAFGGDGSDPMPLCRPDAKHVCPP